MEEREKAQFKTYFKDDISSIENVYNETFQNINNNKTNKQWLQNLSDKTEEYQENIFKDLKDKFDDFTANLYQAAA